MFGKTFDAARRYSSNAISAGHTRVGRNSYSGWFFLHGAKAIGVRKLHVLRMATSI